MQARVVYEPKTASGKRASWARLITGVNDSGLKGSKAFEGVYLREYEQDVEVGSLVLEVVPVGSVKNGGQEARLYRIAADGSLAPVDGVEPMDWSRNFLTIRDTVARLLGEAPNPLAGFSDAELWAELERRGSLAREA